MTVDQGALEAQNSSEAMAAMSSPAEIDAMEPCTYSRPCTSTREGRAEAHSSFQAARREYDDACTAAGIRRRPGHARRCQRPKLLQQSWTAFSFSPSSSAAPRFYRFYRKSTVKGRHLHVGLNHLLVPAPMHFLALRTPRSRVSCYAQRIRAEGMVNI